MNQKTRDDLWNLVKTNYKEIADDFNDTRKKVIWPELVRLADLVEKGSSVLDAGCGNGRLLQAFRFKPIRYVGLDYNDKFIHFAKESWQIPDGLFIEGDILEMERNPLLKEYFDHIFCVAVIHCIPGDSLRIEALKQLKNKLKDNGKLIVTVWNLWSKPKYLALLFKYSALKLLGMNKMDYGDIVFDWEGKVKSKRYYHAFTKRGLENVFSLAGLRIEKLYKDRFNYYIIAKK